MSEIPEFKFAIREDLVGCGIDFLPTRAEPKATGWDVRAATKDKKDIILNAFDKVYIPLGFRGFCPEGWWYELKPRSSTFGKKSLHCLYGTIDQAFEGELLLACQYIPVTYFDQTWFEDYEYEDVKFSTKPLVIKFGDPIGQIIPVKRKEMKVTEITNEEYDRLCKDRGEKRGSGGFGSTG